MIINRLTDTADLDKESAKLISEGDVVASLIRKHVEENTNTAIDQAEYQSRYDSLIDRYEAIKNGLSEIDDKRLMRNAKRSNIEHFISRLEKNEGILESFDEGLWDATIEKIIVESEHEVVFVFKDGMELKWNIRIIECP